MPSQGLLAFLLLSAVAVAGCSGGPAPATAPEPDDRRVSDDHEQGQAEGTGCVGRLALAFPTVANVQAQLPAGQVARAYAEDVVPVGAVSAVAIRCAAMTVGNVTATDVGIAWVDAFVIGGQYRWHFVVDEAADGPRLLTQVLENASWPFIPGVVDVRAGAFQFGWEAGDLRMAATIGNVVPTTTNDPFGQEAILSVDGTGTLRTLTQSFGTGADVTTFSGSRFEVDEGPLAALEQANGPLAGVGNDLNSSWTIQLTATTEPSP